MTDKGLGLLIGAAAAVSPLLHILSDVLEVLGGGFSLAQLWASYIAFLVVPFFMVGLHAIQGPRAGRVSLIGAVAYGAAFIFFAGTAIVAIVTRAPDYTALTRELGAAYTVHGGLMVIGGLLFGLAVIRAAVLPRWTGITLIVGVLLNALFELLAVPAMTQLIGSTVRSIAFIGMGMAVLAATSSLKPTSGTLPRGDVSDRLGRKLP